MLQKQEYDVLHDTVSTFDERQVADALKTAMRQLASGVAVISTDQGGAWHGMTATSVISLSMDPPSVLVCINRTATIHGPLMEAGAFCINFLSGTQEEVCTVFSSKSRRGERFADGLWKVGPSHLPYHPLAVANIFCAVDQVHEYGTHSVVLSRVRHVTEGMSEKRSPMIYLDGRFIQP
ncbi:hypothetical protein N825_29135 [Skermanella stibiiresistens SB22]|uniref:Flavin reductase like domain-containing protein n=1 Tax=Skermanella stibiiresistens SB22 TaxID=1385369 RepID=W9GR89_9PROT|nr:flavin reductase family protein [Skermanella stibiiresistens]EWY36264.1 hypothetical protein N825_29135 [Skermanella stibiiresistens SB22]